MTKNLYQLSLEEENPTPLIFDDMGEDLEEVLAAQAEVEYQADGIGQAAYAADRLSKIVDIVESQTDQDACPAVMDSMMLDVILESIYQQLGVKVPKELALEDFSALDGSPIPYPDRGESSKSTSSVTWGEKAARIKEQMMRLLEAIIEALRQAYQNLKAYLNKVFSVAARLEKYAIQQIRIYRLLDGSASQETYESARLSQALYCPDASLLKTYERLFDLVEDAERSAASGYVPLMAKLVNRFVDKGDMKDFVSEFAAVFEGMFSHIFKHDASNEIIESINAPEGATINTSEYLPGGYLAVLASPEFTDTIGQFVFGIKRPNDKETVDTALKVLSRGEIVDSLDLVIKICRTIRTFEVVEKKNGSLVDQLTQATKRLKNTTHPLTDKEKLFLKSLARIAPSLARGIHQQTFTFALTSCKALVEHCKKSADFYLQST